MAPPVGRVSIEPGCIACNLCEETAPKVFRVADGNCTVRPDADLSDAERIRHAAEECPVSVIKVEDPA